MCRVYSMDWYKKRAACSARMLEKLGLRNNSDITRFAIRRG